METWELEIENRIPVGIAFGWSYFGKDESYDYNELRIYLGIISLNFKWQ